MDLDDLPGYRLAITGQYDGIYSALTVDAANARAAALAPYTARVIEALALPDAGWHMDLGCGDGLIGLAVARARPRMSVLGVDASERALALAYERARVEGLRNFALVHADAETPPEGAFDRISATSVFNLLPDKRAALTAWRRVAAPGARLVITDGFDVRGAGTLRAGAASHAGLDAAARGSGWRVIHRDDLTPLVRKLHAAKQWIWPEYVRDGIRYELVVLQG